MWARVVELLLGGWLVASPWLFQHSPGEQTRWWTDLGAGTLIVLFALLSWRPRLHRAHLLSTAVALWLIGVGFVGSPHPPLPALQNDFVVGLLLLTFAIVPSKASRPPAAWGSLPELRGLDASPPSAEPGRR